MERDTESKLVCYSLTSSHHVLVLDCEILEVRDPDLLISVPIHHCPPMPSMVPDSQLLNGDSEDGHRKKKQEGNHEFSELETILLCDLAKGSLMDLFSSPYG